MTSESNPELVQANLETLQQADIPVMTMDSTMTGDGTYSNQAVNLVVERNTGRIIEVRKAYSFFDDTSPQVNVSISYQRLLPGAKAPDGVKERLAVLDDDDLDEAARLIIQASCAGYAQAVAG